jgi:hypothetical protein
MAKVKEQNSADLVENGRPRPDVGVLSFDVIKKKDQNGKVTDELEVADIKIAPHTNSFLSMTGIGDPALVYEAPDLTQGSDLKDEAQAIAQQKEARERSLKQVFTSEPEGVASQINPADLMWSSNGMSNMYGANFGSGASLAVLFPQDYILTRDLEKK